MTRTVPEWIGKDDNSVPPPRVRLRIFIARDGRCHCCNRPIRLGEEWQADHIVALINSGENRESNLAPILRAHHKAKTRDDVAIKSKTYRTRKSHRGINRAKRTIPGRRFDGTPIPSRWRA